MIRNRESFDMAAAEHGWTVDPFLLFNGHTMTTYGKGDRQVRVETDTYGGIRWVALCENGWINERLDLDHDKDITMRGLAWLADRKDHL